MIKFFDFNDLELQTSHWLWSSEIGWERSSEFENFSAFDWSYHLPIKSNKLILCERIFFHSAPPNPSLGFVFGLDKSYNLQWFSTGQTLHTDWGDLWP